MSAPYSSASGCDLPSRWDSRLYAHGTTSRVKKVETMTPPMTVMAMGTRLSAPGPSASAGGMAAASVASEVMRIGRRRIGPAERMASRMAMPSMKRRALQNSTSRMEFFFTMPISSTTPMRL